MPDKKKPGKKPSVKVRDLRSKKNPKGGAADVFAKLGDIKGESRDHKHKDMSAVKINSTLIDSSSLKIK